MPKRSFKNTLLFLALANSGAHAAGSYAQLIRRDGQPIYCAEADKIRQGNLEQPLWQAVPGKREFVDVLSLQVLKLALQSVDGQDELYLKVRFQLASCLETANGKRAWFLEEPDNADFVESSFATSWFGGSVRRADFQKRTVVDMASDSVENVATAEFHWPLDKIFSRTELKNYRSEKQAYAEMSLSYRYSQADSPQRPSLPVQQPAFRKSPGIFPAHYSLTLTFLKNQAELLRFHSSFD